MSELKNNDEKRFKRISIYLQEAISFKLLNLFFYELVISNKRNY